MPRAKLAGRGARHQPRVAAGDVFSLRWRIRFRRAPEPVAVSKSWDVWAMYQAALAHAPDRTARVFEMGSYNSEIPLVLWRAGYHNIRASDFNPLGRGIRWYGNAIDFRYENFYDPDLAPGSGGGVMTAPPVIEHGYDQGKLIGTAVRLLETRRRLPVHHRLPRGGIAVPPEERWFGLPYWVFSRADIESLVWDAAVAGLELIAAGVGVVRLSDRVEGRKFTFLFVGLRKAR